MSPPRCSLCCSAAVSRLPLLLLLLLESVVASPLFTCWPFVFHSRPSVARRRSGCVAYRAFVCRRGPVAPGRDDTYRPPVAAFLASRLLACLLACGVQHKHHTHSGTPTPQARTTTVSSTRPPPSISPTAEIKTRPQRDALIWPGLVCSPSLPAEANQLRCRHCRLPAPCLRCSLLLLSPSLLLLTRRLHTCVGQSTTDSRLLHFYTYTS